MGGGELTGRILGALAKAGLDLEHLSIDDLASIDEFHSRPRRATEELARMLARTASGHAIDVGSGLGGPSRYLAVAFGCQVSGVDLSLSSWQPQPNSRDTWDRQIRWTSAGGWRRIAFPCRDLRSGTDAERRDEHCRPAAIVCRDAPAAEARCAVGDLGRGPGSGRSASLPGDVGGSTADQLPATRSLL
jgi:hypothetical protein